MEKYPIFVYHIYKYVKKGDDMTSKEIGEALKKIRKEKRIKQGDLAREFDFTQSALSTWEKGKYKMSAEDFINIVNYFDDTKVLSMFFPKFQSKEDFTNLSREEKELVSMYRNADEDLKAAVVAFIKAFNNTYEKKQVSFIPMIHESSKNKVKLDYYSSPASMGYGNYLEAQQPEKINVLEDRVPEKTDFVIKVTGDSMEPTYFAGDLLCIQKTNNLEKGEIGVFNLDGDEVVKEYGGNVLISHNKKYRPIRINTDCYIQGKVLGRLK